MFLLEISKNNILCSKCNSARTVFRLQNKTLPYQRIWGFRLLRHVRSGCLLQQLQPKTPSSLTAGAQTGTQGPGVSAWAERCSCCFPIFRGAESEITQKKTQQLRKKYLYSKKIVQTTVIRCRAESGKRTDWPCLHATGPFYRLSSLSSHTCSSLISGDAPFFPSLAFALSIPQQLHTFPQTPLK